MIKKKLKNSQHNKGKLLFEAVKDSTILNSIRRQKQIFYFATFFMFCGVLAIAILIYSFFTISLNFDRILLIVFVISILILFIIICFLAIYTTSFSKDQIYENGISSFNHTIFDYLNGNTFHFFNEISKIGWGYDVVRSERNRPFRFLVIYKNNENRHTTTFDDKYITNDFFGRLIEVLKKKCANIPWVRVDWRSLPYPK